MGYSKKRKKHSAEFKINLLKRHLIDGESVSCVCEETAVKPSLFYTWQKELFTSGQLVFEQSQQKKGKRYDG